MATNTTNYGWTKPSYEDAADIEVINGTIDNIDAQVKTNENNILYIEKANGKKNLVPNFEAITNGGCTYTYGAGGVVTVTGTKSGALSIATVIDNANLSNYGLSAGDSIVLVSDNANIGTVVIFEDEQGTQDAAISAYNEVKSVTIPSGRTKWYVRLQVKPATTGTINETAKPMICDKKLYDIDPTVTPYAMSNIELTTKEQVNENNISLLAMRKVYAAVHNTSTAHTYTMTVSDFNNSQAGTYLITIVTWSTTPSFSLYAASYSGNQTSITNLTKIAGADANISVTSGVISCTTTGKIQIIAVQ